jgi:hypothetical protein
MVSLRLLLPQATNFEGFKNELSIRELDGSTVEEQYIGLERGGSTGAHGVY